MKTKIKEIINDVPMGEYFIIQALDYYTKEILDQEDRCRNEMKHSIIDADFWINNAKMIREILL